MGVDAALRGACEAKDHDAQECAEALVLAGADVNRVFYEDGGGVSMLVLSAENVYDNKTLGVLLKYGANVDARDDRVPRYPEGNMALRAACKAGNARNIELLLARGVDVNVGSNLFLVLNNVYSKDSVASVETLLRHPDIVVTLDDLYGAYYAGQALLLVDHLIEHGQSAREIAFALRKRARDFTICVLCAARCAEHASADFTLMDVFDDYRDVDDLLFNVVSWLCHHRHHAGPCRYVMDLCRRHSADTARLFTRVLALAHDPADDVIIRLLENGASPDVLDAKGRRPIHRVCGANAVRWFLSRGADVDEADAHGAVALVHARWNTYAELLLRAGATVVRVSDMNEEYYWGRRAVAGVGYGLALCAIARVLSCTNKTVGCMNVVLDIVLRFASDVLDINSRSSDVDVHACVRAAFLQRCPTRHDGETERHWARRRRGALVNAILGPEQVDP